MTTMQGSSAVDESGGGKRTAGAFDIRVFIGLLVGIYGIVLVLMGLFGTSDRDLNRAGGINVNLWAGIGMVIVSGVLLTWARLRPLVVAAEPDEDADPADRGVQDDGDNVNPDAGRA